MTTFLRAYRGPRQPTGIVRVPYVPVIRAPRFDKWTFPVVRRMSTRDWNLASVQPMRLRSSPIVARTLKLKARWTCDVKQDLSAYHSVGAEDRLIDLLEEVYGEPLRGSTMRQVRIKKKKLLDIIKKNREEHRDIFLKAQKKYREVAINALDAQLTAARSGRPFVLQELTQLIAPEDHTKDYDRVIEMLEMCVDAVIVVSEEDFQHYVQDVWSWSKQWAYSNSRYVSSPKLSAMMAED